MKDIIKDIWDNVLKEWIDYALFLKKLAQFCYNSRLILWTEPEISVLSDPGERMAWLDNSGQSVTFPSLVNSQSSFSLNQKPQTSNE